MNLHEMLGVEVEKRIIAENQQNENFATFQSFAQAVLMVKRGERKIEDLNVGIAPRSISWNWTTPSILSIDTPPVPPAPPPS